MNPAGMNVPSGPSWYRLILWLLGLGENLPAAAIRDVVNLYTAWSRGMLGRDPLTPTLLHWLFYWLRQIETARDAGTYREHHQLFGGGLDYEELNSLEADLRTGFLLFCNRTPALAADYLRSLIQHRHHDRVGLGVLKFRGTLAQAAPAELAELTAITLIPEPSEEEEYVDRYERREPLITVIMNLLGHHQPRVHF